jgi:hypothetical protein
MVVVVVRTVDVVVAGARVVVVDAVPATVVVVDVVVVDELDVVVVSGSATVVVVTTGEAFEPVSSAASDDAPDTRPNPVTSMSAHRPANATSPPETLAARRLRSRMRRIDASSIAVPIGRPGADLNLLAGAGRSGPGQAAGGQSGVTVSTARQQYQATIER